MIFDDLYSYYLRMSQGDDPVLPRRFWSIEKVAWEFVIDAQGKLVSVIPLADADAKIKYKNMSVPEHETRTSVPKAFLLCDKADYFLGRNKKGAKCEAECRSLHAEVLTGVDDSGAYAILSFLDDAHRADEISEELLEQLDKGGFIVFRLMGDSGYIHERPPIIKAWSSYKEGSKVSTGQMQCAVTGELCIPAKLHPQIRGVMGAQSSGASLIGFNQEAFCSYGKTKDDQGRNASISDDVAFGVGTALGYLVNNRDHNVHIGNDTVVFWTDRYTSPVEDDLFDLMVDPDDSRRNAKEDSAKLDQLEATLESIRSGKRIPGIDEGTRYYLLGLSPNSARLSIRFYETWTLGQLEDNFRMYLQDIEIIGERSHSIRTYLNQTAPLGKSSDVPATLINSSTDAMLNGRAFPYALYTALISRTRSDHASRNGWDLGQRAAMIKACLIRQARSEHDESKERRITVSLNEDNDNAGYLLGRLFALLEKVQQDAIPGANATIRDRYIGAASSTPGRVFPQLMRMAQHHISKSDYGNLTDRLIQEVISRFSGEEGFPNTLSYEDQGQFMIGYYQQKQALYTSKKGIPASDDSDSDGSQE